MDGRDEENLQSSTNVDIVFGKGTDISRPFVVVNDLFMVKTCNYGRPSNRSGCANCRRPKHHQGRAKGQKERK